MDSSSAQQHQHQEMGLQTLESMLGCKDNKKARPADMQALKCPRCDSTNTKFCYYNNYSLSQPRYFCKSCRRYWTKGGTLRNVPVGGGCRKNKRSSSSSSATSSATTSSSSKRSPPAPLPPLNYDSNDLNLAIARLHTHNSGHLGLDDHRDFSIWGNSGGNPNSDALAGGGGGLFDAIRSGVFDNNGNNGMHNLYYGGGVGGSGEIMSGAHEMGMSSMPAPAPSSYEDYGAGGVVSTSTAVTTVKHEGVDGRILWGFPWQNVNSAGAGAGAGDGSGSDFESARLNWGGIAASNWQGLLNSPLT